MTNPAETPVPEKQFYTYAETAAIIGVHHQTIWKWVKKGTLKPSRFSKKAVYIHRDEIGRFKALGHVAQ